ncbi:MAG TPA: YibE/F family protein [Candidatus Paceibacterota bacterium]|nr:YibE/F family protein [Candidatus Paceibacterota bacterium]
MKFFLGAIVLLGMYTPALAQEVIPDTVLHYKAQVLEVLSQREELIPGTNTNAIYQTIRVKLLDGPREGEEMTLENDFLELRVGDVFYLRHTSNIADGRDFYSVAEPYRVPVLAFFVGLFLLCLFVFGGKQGVRGLIALALSLFFIIYLLLPGIVGGYPPMLVAIGVAALIIVLGSYITHGFTITTTTAVIGMLITIAVTGALAYLAIDMARLSGFASDESVYLNFDTGGAIDLVGLLMGSILIGLLGVLYDAAIGQSVAVEELMRAGGHLSPKEIYWRAVRIGREHIGALVNTLAIAYVGAALPLILLFKVSYTQSPLISINQELFATEILRTVIGSIGIILAVPITTAIAVWMLYKKSRNGI